MTLPSITLKDTRRMEIEPQGILEKRHKNMQEAHDFMLIERC